MPTEPNPYAPPAADESGGQRRVAPPAEAPLDLFTLTQPGGTTWTLSIHPEIIRLEPADGRPARQLDHHDFAAQATFTFFGKKNSLVLRAPSPALVLPLSPEALAALRAWMEPSLGSCLAKALASHRMTAFVIGALWVLGSVGTAKHPTEPIGIAFGVLWLAWAAAATIKPHRALFLGNAALWVGTGVSFAVRVFQGASLWELLLILLVWPAISSRLRWYRFYGPIENATF